MTLTVFAYAFVAFVAFAVAVAKLDSRVEAKWAAEDAAR